MGVVIEPGAYIEHPEQFVVGDRVRIMRGVTFIQRQAEVQLGNDVALFPGVFVQGTGRLILDENVEFYPYNYLSIGGEKSSITVGRRSHFAAGCALYGHATLTVGEFCAVAAHTVITTVGHDHRRLDRPMVDGARMAPIVLTRDIWIGANATVVAGVTIAEGCVIGAGAVVTRDTEPFGVYLGVPARFSHSRKTNPTA